MLVVTRRVGEKVVIDENVTLRILACTGNTVRFGVEGPAEVSFDRQEVRRRKRCAAPARPRDPPQPPPGRSRGRAQ